MEDVTGNVEAIEVEAERLLEEARNKAREIHLRARGEVGKILSSEFSLAEAEAECERIIQKAGEEADSKAADAERRAAEVRSVAGAKTGEIIGSIVAIVSGAASRES